LTSTSSGSSFGFFAALSALILSSYALIFACRSATSFATALAFADGLASVFALFVAGTAVSTFAFFASGACAV